MERQVNKPSKISSSPQRNTFQKEKYIERCQNEGKQPSQEYLDMFLDEEIRRKSKFDKPESRVNNLEYDLLTTDWILNKVRKDEAYAQNLYAAMCNNEFVKNDVWPRLKDERYSVSWRYAGGIIADMLQEGDYIDWYCSGIKDIGVYAPENENEVLTEEQLARMAVVGRFVGEGNVTDEIREDLLKLGWITIDDDSLE
jgi:hypothetical protein